MFCWLETVCVCVCCFEAAADWQRGWISGNYSSPIKLSRGSAADIYLSGKENVFNLLFTFLLAQAHFFRVHLGNLINYLNKGTEPEIHLLFCILVDVSNQAPDKINHIMLRSGCSCSVCLTVIKTNLSWNPLWQRVSCTADLWSNLIINALIIFAVWKSDGSWSEKNRAALKDI